MFQDEVKKLLAKDPTHRSSNRPRESKTAAIIDTCHAVTQTTEFQSRSADEGHITITSCPNCPLRADKIQPGQQLKPSITAPHHKRRPIVSRGAKKGLKQRALERLKLKEANAELAAKVLKQPTLERLKRLKEADAELASSSEDEVEIYRSIPRTSGNTRDRNEAAALALAAMKPKAAKQYVPPPHCSNCSLHYFRRRPRIISKMLCLQESIDLPCLLAQATLRILLL
ncbi:hypothetical protein DFH27DRAFT_605635 [Peziza echinospora]|nr:hypothetical protein DFH27DRAFT_605635 [Peziza echinospora]